MIKFGKKLGAMIMSAVMALTFAPAAALTSLAAEDVNSAPAAALEKKVPVYGLYNPNSGEHVFTIYQEEYDMLKTAGWTEGDVKWYAPASGDPVYRLYNPNVTDLSGNPIGDHYYTRNIYEVRYLISLGWLEGDIVFYSADESDGSSVPVYGAYNPNAYPSGGSGAHHFTIDGDETKNLLALGWEEGDAKFRGYPITEIDKVIKNMSMDEKISQMIIPALRSYNGNNVTDLNAVPELKEALKKHQYGGVILFAQNIAGTEQVTRLLNDLQENNLSANASTHIPYLTTVDEEGGIVIRLNSGTRMTGNMAIGATKNSVENAQKTGVILGEELAAIGFNADFAPVIDVNNNPENPVIGTRSFSDDPELVAELGSAYSKGLMKSNIIPTFKHFPGHGDTSTDSHSEATIVNKTYDEIKKMELVPFKQVIDNGADMIMTDHITYPLIDEEVTFGDGITKGFYPATMSKKMITDVLRNDMGFEGVVITDALEMGAINKTGLVPGEPDSTEYRLNVAEKVINAGVDILLIPTDLINDEAIAFYDDYIAGIEEKVRSGEVSAYRINESVQRILQLKEDYAIFVPSKNGYEGVDIDEKVKAAIQTVGSIEHHETEMEIAKEAITIVKNDSGTLPVARDCKNVVVLGRLQSDLMTIGYEVGRLKIYTDVLNEAEIMVDYYYDSSAEVKFHYTDEVKEKIQNADVVIGFSNASGKAVLNKENAQNIAIQTLIEDTHKAGGRFILISQNLPYDAAVFQDADAIVLAYLGSGLNLDPTENTESGSGLIARNANILAAIDTVFGLNQPSGKLPVNIPKVIEQPDGTLAYGKEFLYERGFGLSW